MPARKDRSNTGAHRPFTNLKFSFAADQGCVADFDTRDVGDRIELSRGSFKRNSQIASANDLAYDCWSRRRRFLRLTR